MQRDYDTTNERILWCQIISDCMSEARRGNVPAKQFFFGEVFEIVGSALFTETELKKLQQAALTAQRKIRKPYTKRIAPTVISGWQTGIEISECF